MAKYEENILIDEKAITKLWSKIDVLHVDNPDACWRWNGQIDKQGYGIMCVHCPQLVGIKKPWISCRVPRLIWMLENDQTIPPKMLAIHSCDNPTCCNPRHIRIGTAQDNVNDRTARGRSSNTPKGEKHPRRKLTDNKVRKICLMYFRQGFSITSIANTFKVQRACISKIISGKNWKHVTKTHIPPNFSRMHEYNKIRNEKIYKQFEAGVTYQELVDQFKLGKSYILKILCDMRKKKGLPPFGRGYKPGKK